MTEAHKSFGDRGQILFPSGVSTHLLKNVALEPGQQEGEWKIQAKESGI